MPRLLIKLRKFLALAVTAPAVFASAGPEIPRVAVIAGDKSLDPVVPLLGIDKGN